MKMSAQHKSIWIGLGVGALFLVLFFTRVNVGHLDLASNFSNSEKALNPKLGPTIISTPFARLTIPYLRTIPIDSQLTDLELFENKGSYQSYLTSYMSEEYRINGLLTIPTSEMPEGGWPAVVLIHGYIPPAQYQTTERYQDYVDYIARNGFVVFKIDLRGHGDSEGEASGAYYSGDYIIDTLHAINALEKSPSVNSARIGLWGHSMAGNVLLRTMAVKPDIKAVVIWAGAVFSYQDWQEYGLSDYSFRLTDLERSDRQSERQELFDTHGQFSPNNEFWRTVPATNYLQDMTGSIQLHHAEDDAVVNIAYSQDLAELLEQAGTSYEFYDYSSGGHNLTGSAFSTAMQRTVEFYHRNLISSE